MRGSASKYLCARCSEPADHWAYCHADVDQQHMSDAKEKGRPYSANPDHYMPLCRSCHIAFDTNRREWATREALPLEHFAGGCSLTRTLSLGSSARRSCERTLISKETAPSACC